MIKTNPLSIKKIEEIASLIRDTYNIGIDDHFPILEVIDKLFVKNQLSYQIVEDNCPIMSKQEVAIYDPIENYLYIKESVITEYENGIYRSSFTLAHEFFHYLQAQVLFFSFEESNHVSTYEDPDWQANEFAGQLLIPSSRLIESTESLMRKYHVSEECVLTRKLYFKRRNKTKRSK